jgi:hypothetical protein
MGSSPDEVFTMLRGEFDEQSRRGEFDNDVDAFMADAVVPVWRDESPEDTGDYIDSVGVIAPALGGAGKVGATDEAANVIEYGSIDTPEFAPRALTEAHFNRVR